MAGTEEGNGFSWHTDNDHHSTISISHFSIHDLRQDEKNDRLELQKAALSNNWQRADSIYKNSGMGYGVVITSRGETALHVAALSGHTDFVKNLAAKMTNEEIRMKTKVSSGKGGNTAFHCAAISGNVETAKAIIMKDAQLSDLAMDPGVGNKLPMCLAAAKGNKDMVRYLYDLVKDQLNYTNRDDVKFKALFMALIQSDIFDVALQLAAFSNDEDIEEEALYELAQKPLHPPRVFDRWIHPYSYKQMVEDYRSAIRLIKQLWESLRSNETRLEALINTSDLNPILEAAKTGNYPFLCIIIASYPDMLFAFDSNKYTIIHHAVMNRHVEIFNFINIGSAQTIATYLVDTQGNNLLHLAAKLAPPNRLNVVPGAALQLQRELLWFEQVEKVMQPHELNRKKFSLSHFPQEQMSLLFKEMNQHLSEASAHEGLFQKLEMVMRQENCELEEYHPIFKDVNKVRTQFDTILMFKKLNKVMEQENNQLQEFTKFWKPLDLIKDIHDQIIIQDKLKQSETSTKPVEVAIKKIMVFMQNHKDLQELIEGPKMQDLLKVQDVMDKSNQQETENTLPRTQYSEIQQLLEIISGLMSHHKENPHDTEGIENIYMELKRNMKINNAWQMHYHRKRVVELFQELKKMMQHHEVAERTNSIEAYTPHEAFVKEHKQLMVDGEKWMRETANSCMIVAALITTIAFAAAITVPGGNADNGFPNFSNEMLFKAFAVADSVSLISSATSLLVYLSILTARYTVDDFRWSLPNKLFVGLLTLFISTVSMMVAFVLSIFITFQNTTPMFSISIAAASSLPVILFLWHHSTLFFDVFLSTYTSYLLFKPGKDPALLFNKSK